MSAKAYVLVVDDDSGIRTAVARLLTHAGYHVETARDGEEAVVRLCAPLTPDLILLDLEMPGMDGFQFRRIQQQYLRWSAIPVVLVSGLAGPEQAAQLNVSGVLPKPIDPDALLAAVEQYRRRDRPPQT